MLQLEAYDKLFTNRLQQLLTPFYSHYTGQPALGSGPSLELEDFVGATLSSAHMPLLMATSAFRLRRKC